MNVWELRLLSGYSVASGYAICMNVAHRLIAVFKSVKNVTLWLAQRSTPTNPPDQDLGSADHDLLLMRGTATLNLYMMCRRE